MPKAGAAIDQLLSSCGLAGCHDPAIGLPTSFSHIATSVPPWSGSQARIPIHPRSSIDYVTALVFPRSARRCLTSFDGEEIESKVGAEAEGQPISGASEDDELARQKIAAEAEESKEEELLRHQMAMGDTWSDDMVWPEDDNPGDVDLPPLPDHAPPTTDHLFKTIDEVEQVKDPFPEPVSPTVEAIAREAGPRNLGHSVADLKLALSELVQHTQSHLRPERITMATTEDVPETLTPLIDTLSQVLQKSIKVQNHLKGITEAADEVLGRADISSGHRENAFAAHDEAASGRGKKKPKPQMMKAAIPQVLLLLDSQLVARLSRPFAHCGHGAKFL